MHWRSVAVQVGSEPEFYQGTEFLLRADERVRVHQLAGFVWVAVHCKNRDKQLTFIVRVSGWLVFNPMVNKRNSNTFIVKVKRSSSHYILNFI